MPKRKLLSITNRSKIFKAQNKCCGICSDKITIGNFELDHIIPHAYGGPDEDINLICLCPNCHRLKTMNFDPIVKRFIKYEANAFSRGRALDLIRSICQFAKLHDNSIDDDLINIVVEEQHKEESSDDEPLTTSCPNYLGYDLPKVRKSFHLDSQAFKKRYYMNEFDLMDEFGTFRTYFLTCFRCGYYTSYKKLLHDHLNNKVPCIARFLDISKEEVGLNYLNYIDEFCDVYRQKQDVVGYGYRIYSASCCDFTSENKKDCEKHMKKHKHHRKNNYN